MNKIFSILLFLTYTLINAQNYNDAIILGENGLGSSARAIGMGNSYIALSDDFSAVYSNPAGLGLIKRLEFAGGMNYNQFNNQSLFFNKENESDISNGSLSQLGLVFPIPTYRGSFVLAVGYNTQKDINQIVKFNGVNTGHNSMIKDLTGFNDDIPYNLGLSYDVNDNTGKYLRDETKINGGLLQSGEIKYEGDISSWAFSSSLEIAKKMFIGLTMNLYTGTYQKIRNYTENDSYDLYSSDLQLVEGDVRTSDFQRFKLVDRVEWDISGYDLKLGWLFQPCNQIRLGATIKFPTSFTIKEKYFVEGRSKFAEKSFYTSSDSDIEYDINTPFEFGFGTAFNFWNMILSAQITYLDYSNIEFDEGFSADELSHKNKEIEEVLDKGMNFNFGLEYYFPKINVRLRTGFIYKKSPYKGDDPEFDKKYFTLGFGLLTSELTSIDIGYAYGWWNSLTDNYGIGQSRIFEEHVSKTFKATLTYRF